MKGIIIKRVYFRDDILSPISLKAQKYNREALGIEGEEFSILPAPEEKKDMDVDYLWEVCREKSLELYAHIKEKMITLINTYQMEDTKNEKKRDGKYKR